MRGRRKSLRINSIPTLGILVFCALFVFAAGLYPGGSQADIDSAGFDWVHNYWCNLMNEKAMNGASNPARPYAVFAMLVLCFSFAVFFLQFSKYLAASSVRKKLISGGGTLSMLFASLMFTEYHDLMTGISSFFGLFAVVGIITEVYRSELLPFKIGGLLCLLLLAANNFIYYSTQFIEYLPLLQKLTFLFVLTWVFGLNFEVRKKILITKS